MQGGAELLGGNIMLFPIGPQNKTQPPNLGIQAGTSTLAFFKYLLPTRAQLTGQSSGNLLRLALAMVLLSRSQSELQNSELAGTKLPILFAGTGSGARLPNPWQ